MERFVVYFDKLGYFADKQPKYGFNWNFTKSVEDAKLYETKKRAKVILDDGIAESTQAHWQASLGNNFELQWNTSKITTGKVVPVLVTVEVK